MIDIAERLATAKNMMELERAAADAIAEIEHLGKELESADRVANDWARQNVELRAEIERLRGLVDACSVYLKEDETPAQRIERERADTEAVLKLLLKDRREIERLRGLLREALTGETHGDWMMRIREALGEKIPR